MMYKHILALDPSGNFHEGKGTTGWVVMNYKEKLIASGFISAHTYDCPEEYWNEILKLIQFNYAKYNDGLIVVMEDYLLYRDKAQGQTNSRLETCRLLGLIQWYCWQNQIPYSFQTAASVKDRWSDDLLLRERILYRSRNKLYHTESNYNMDVIHVRDALRHALHYVICRNNTKKPTKRKRITRFENYTGGRYA